MADAIEDTGTEEMEESNAFEMSDEEFLQQEPSFIDAPVDTEQEADDSAQDDENAAESTESEETEDDPEDQGEAAPEASEDADEEGEEDPSDDADDSDEEDDLDTEETEVDYAAIGKLLMGEFKANGRTMKMKSPEDAITLMQMGANYHKKMSSLKPSLKTLKLLEKNALLDPEKLNYLIDLEQKKPEAIKKLLKDSGIDPMDLDLEADDEYVPQDRTVDDAELQLDDVLESIQGTPTYQKTLNVLGKEWDAESRTTVANHPGTIKTINDHIASGIFDQVTEAVEYQRSLGKFAGVSDFQAYRQMGEHMEANNLLSLPTGTPNQSAPKQTSQTNDQSPKTSTSAAAAESRKARKKAVSTTRKTKAPAKTKKDYNPLELSDEEFLKINNLNLD